MKRILVGIKRVVDYNIRIRVRPDGSGVITDGVKQSINPFDEIALEEALRLREKGQADEVVVVSIGPAEVQNQLRTALAMGADRALLVNSPRRWNHWMQRRHSCKLVEREQPLLVLLGKQAIDDDNNQTGQMLAGLWDRPQATFASRVELGGNSARVTREVDAGLETIEVDLPAVVTVDLRLNEPRYVKLPDIIKAKKKPLDTLELAALGITPRPQLKAVHFAPPPVRGKGVMVKDVGELVSALAAKGLIQVNQRADHCRARWAQARRCHCPLRALRAGAGRRGYHCRRVWPRALPPWRAEAAQLSGVARVRVADAPGFRASTGGRAGAADGRHCARLHSCVRALDHLRQGPDAARGRAAGCARGQRRDGGGIPHPLPPSHLCRQCHRHGGSRCARPVVATVRTASFSAVAPRRPAPRSSRWMLQPPAVTHTRFIEVSTPKGDRPDLQSARVRGVRWPRAGQRREIPADLPAGRRTGRGRGRVARRGGFRLCAQ